MSNIEKTAISIADQEALKAAAIASIVKVPILMKWKIKAHSHWMLPGDLAFGSVAVMAWCIYLWILLFMDESSIRDSLTRSATALPMFASFFWWGARKKTVWNYIISSEGGFIEFWEDYFQTTKYFFKGLAVFAIACVITMIAIAPSLILAIVGIGGMVVLAAIKLMAWENDVSWKLFTWDRPQIIFTDRKRGLVVFERHHNPELPFWENYLYIQVFLPKDQIDDFLALCRKYAPGDAEYKEGNFRE